MPTYSYQQVFNSLRTQITSGLYAPGDFLPPEPELEKQFRVSRTTVRKAVELLRVEGLVHVQQGRGTTIARWESLPQHLNHVTSFSETLRALGKKACNRKLSIETMPAGLTLALELNVPEDEELFRLRRLVEVDGHPLAVMTNHLVARYFPKLAVDDRWVPSLYRFLEDHYGLIITSAIDRLSARLATKEEAQLLLLKSPSALLIDHRISTDQRGPFESMESLADATRHEFSVQCMGRPGR
jgi:GntR family transcriptional regulator